MESNIKQPMSDTLIVNLLLAFSGGFQDAYTYFIRDHVFANAQTGNVILFSFNLLNTDFTSATRYLFPIIAFVLGIILADLIRHKFKKASFHWRLINLSIIISILAMTSVMPFELNFMANMMISFSCAIQVQTFRKICGHPYASTMCIGNLRFTAEAISKAIYLKDKKQLQKVVYYILVIMTFGLGASIGAVLSLTYGIITILISCFVLSIAYILMLFR